MTNHVRRCVLAALALAAPAALAGPSLTGDVYVAANQDLLRFSQRGVLQATMIGPIPGDTFYQAVRVIRGASEEDYVWAADEKHGRIDLYTRDDKRFKSIDTNAPDPARPEIGQQQPTLIAADGQGRVYIGGKSGQVLIYSAETFEYLGHVGLPPFELSQQALDVDCDGSTLFYASVYSAPGYCEAQISRYDLLARSPMPPLVLCESEYDPYVEALRVLPSGLILTGGMRNVRLLSPAGETLWLNEDLSGRCTALALDPMRTDRVIAKFSRIMGERYPYALAFDATTGAILRDLDGLGFGRGVAVRGDVAPCLGWTTPTGDDNAILNFCPADLNGDGVIDFGDYLEFLNLFDALDPRVDFSGDGVIDFGDYLEFLNLFEAGC